MKFLCYGFAVLVVLAGSRASAQQIESAPAEVIEPSREPRKLTDQLPSRATPIPSPSPTADATPTPAPQPTSISVEADAPDPRSPEEVVADFFGALQSDDVDAAYEGLSAGSMLKTRGEESLELRARTQGAMDAYGPVKGFELVRMERVGTMLERRTYVLLGEVLPLRWTFYFYKGSGNWKLVDLRVDDALIDLFDQAGVSGNP